MLLARSVVLVLVLVSFACAGTQPVATPSTPADAPPPPSQPAHEVVAPAVLDGLLGAERLHVPLADLPARAALAPGEDFKVVELGRDAHSSHHVVALRDREPVHRHDLHDLLVVTLEGHGRMLIGSEERVIGPRSIVYIPRGVPHSMRNGSAAPLYGYAVFTPPFDGEDRVPVEP
jgi:mannose-6-phosphate isomerase-like protein (cupin superfamily)